MADQFSKMTATIIESTFWIDLINKPLTDPDFCSIERRDGQDYVLDKIQPGPRGSKLCHTFAE